MTFYFRELLSGNRWRWNWRDV